VKKKREKGGWNEEKVRKRKWKNEEIFREIATNENATHDYVGKEKRT